jgi:hypothetical protein
LILTSTALALCLVVPLGVKRYVADNCRDPS